MKEQYHQAIVIQALNSCFSQAALDTIVAANLGQDAWRYQFAHDHFHYDSNAFAAGDSYIADQRRSVMDALRRGEVIPAREAFGRLTHTAQDFYAHSNYVALWREKYPGCGPEEIDPALVELLTDSRLRSGRFYYPFEWLWFNRRFKPWVEPLLPRDSHAWMNIDEPSRPGFDYAFAAAVKRTQLEYSQLVEKLSNPHLALFTGNLPQPLP